MSGRTLVAGVGNVFLRDDAFGVEVIRLLSGRPVPDGVQVKDFGIRGVHLAYDLLDGCELFVLVDAAQRGEPPGTVTVLEVEVPEPDPAAGPVIDAHSLTPDGIFALLGSLGGRPGRSLLVACEPADVSAGMGLSEPVLQALPHAVRTVEEIIAERGRSMHEYGLAEGVLATVRQRAAGRKVAGIRVRFGVKHAVDEESMAQAWGFVAEGTEAEGSAVALVTVPATLTCQDCGLTAETTDVLAICPGCRGENVEISGGDEMTLESITYEPARTG